LDRNLLLAFALSFAVLMLWTMTQEQTPTKSSPKTMAGVEQATPEAGSPTSLPPAPGALTATSTPPPSPGTSTTPSPPPSTGGRVIAVDGQVFRAELNSLGAVLQHFELSNYSISTRDPSPVVLVEIDGLSGGTLAMPFEELGHGNLAHVVWEVEREDPYEIVFALNRDGVTIRKTFRFDPMDFRFGLSVEVKNQSDGPIEPRFALLWPAHQRKEFDFAEQSLVTLHGGGVETELLSGIGTGGFLGSFTGSPPDLFHDFPSPVEWAGVQTTYFLSAMLPDDPGSASVRLAALQPGVSGVAQLFFPPVQIPPGLSASREFVVYAGPKDVDRLEALGSQAIQAIDLGWSWVSPLTRFFGWMLHEIYTFVPNYGVAIILLTVLVRVVMIPLTVKQMRSMERMRTLQPKIKELQEKHKDDRTKQSEEMMALYRREKVNPLGGCLPMVLQLPVFIGLFYALRGSIQLRQAPFFGWIDDLSAPETLFTIPGIDLPIRLLPVIMGASMVIQQKITPTPQVDPTQARMMMTIMPIMMTVVFYGFASGLVLYWMVSNVLAISHQLWIGRRMRSG
jgi:YidC/Oxa1 family membrane protein insertase